MDKNFPRRAKKVLGYFALNSENGVKTPRWRILGTKNATLFGANKFAQKYLYFALLAQMKINCKYLEVYIEKKVVL